MTNSGGKALSQHLALDTLAYANLRRAGMPISINDIWIAATAIEAGAHLVTFDQDFARIDSMSCTILA